MLNQYFKYFLPVLILLLSLGCNSSENDLKPLRIGMNTWPGYEPFILAKEKSFLNDNVKISRVDSATDVIRAFKSGIIDVACLTLDEAIILQDKSNDKIKIITIMYFSNGGDAIIAKKSISSLNDLKGKYIGLESSALGSYMISRAIEFTPELNLSDLKIINLGYEHHEKEFYNGNLDAVVTFEPVKTRLLDHGDAHVLFDSTQIPGEILDVMIVKQKTIDNKRKAIQAVVDGWYKSVEHISKQKKISLEKMAEYENITTKEFEIAYKSITVPNRDYNIDFFDNNMSNTITIIENILLKKKFIKEKISNEAIYSKEFLR